MELKTITCPNCGANTTNAENCDYCGSLLVRFIDKGIEIDTNKFKSDALEYSGLLSELKSNLILQTENPNEFCSTDIFWKITNGDTYSNGNQYSLCVANSGTLCWNDGSKIILGSDNEGLIIHLDFSNYTDVRSNFFFNRTMDELLKRFKQLKSFSLFSAHICSFTDYGGKSRYGREYAVNFGKDAEGAAALISEILYNVYKLKTTDNYDIFTNVGADNVNQARNSWLKSNGYIIENTNQIVESEDEKKERGKIIFWVGIILIILILIFG